MREDDAARLVALVRATPAFMRWLAHVRSLGLAHWCIGAGALRTLVWDALHERHEPSALHDVDVAFFDATDLGAARDHALQARLHAIEPDVPWEVTNQAGVHLWFGSHFGHAVEPLNSLEEAVASWPEYATAVGVALAEDDTLRVIAPHGLADLFDMVVRRNPTRVSVQTYDDRVRQKRYDQRWPRVRIVPA